MESVVTYTDRLAGKVAVVSGGARGMGVSHSRALVAAGARVVAFDVNVGEGPSLAEELGTDNYHFMTGDVTDSGDWANVVQTCHAHFGIPNVLVNNAGISPLHSLAKVTESEYRP